MAQRKAKTKDRSRREQASPISGTLARQLDHIEDLIDAKKFVEAQQELVWGCYNWPSNQPRHGRPSEQAHSGSNPLCRKPRLESAEGRPPSAYLGNLVVPAPWQRRMPHPSYVDTSESREACARHSS
jgi:hypothetical protein